MYRFKIIEKLLFYFFSTVIVMAAISCSDRGDKKFSSEEKKASEKSDDSLQNDSADQRAAEDASSENGLPDNAQTKGSFTVYTSPKDPKPLQEYWIIVQMELPGNLKDYDPSDMFINVRGTDDYVARIKDGQWSVGPQVVEDITMTDWVEYSADKEFVEFKLLIPGAYRNVQDSIEVQSKILDESQNFVIMF